MSKNFSETEINWFISYEMIRRSGQINMFDAVSGCALSGLTREQYIFVMHNYAELQDYALKNNLISREI